MQQIHVDQKRNKSEMNRFIEMNLGMESFAIPLLVVREVISIPDITPIPKTPDHFLGIINLRGQVISVIDLRKKLKIAPKQNNEEVIIIVDIGKTNIGIVVDSINKVLSFSKEDISEMQEVRSQVSASFIQGVYKKEKSLVILLDVAKILDFKDLESIGETKKAA